MSGTGGLQEALSALLTVAARAGVAEDTARREALALAAALAESAPGAPADWAKAVPGGTTQDFFDAAVRGRRWRGAPTAVLTELIANGSAERAAYAEALAELASAACTLGEPTMRVVGNASVAAAHRSSLVLRHGILCWVLSLAVYAGGQLGCPPQRQRGTKCNAVSPAAGIRLRRAWSH